MTNKQAVAKATEILGSGPRGDCGGEEKESMKQLVETEWRPFEAVVIDYRIGMFDCRTQPEPFAMIVEAISTDKHGDRHAKPSLKEAKRSVREAMQLLSDSMKDNDPGTAAMGVLYCLFALRAANYISPVVVMAGSTNGGRVIEMLSGALAANDQQVLMGKVVEALLSIGYLVPHDEMAELTKARSCIWSADLAGFVMFVDVSDSKEGRKA